MKAQDVKYGNDIYIVGIYFREDACYFLHMNRSIKNIYIAKDKDVYICSDTIDPGFKYGKMYSEKGIYHHYLLDNESILTDVMENNDKDKYNEFLQVLISEGLVPKDFYIGTVQRTSPLVWIGERPEWGLPYPK